MIRNGELVSFEEYCKDRREILTNEWSLHFEEVNTQCPICGREFLYKAATSLMKGAEIAHIFPNSPTASEKVILKDVEVDGEDSECSGCTVIINNTLLHEKDIFYIAFRF